MSSLPAALLDPSRKFITLYGTTPPRADALEDRIERAATRLAGRVAKLKPDGLVVYDVQDEAGRTSEPRPFPFLPTLPSRDYARLLQTKSGLPTIVYKCIAQMPADEWQNWLNTTAADYEIHCLSLVGRASSRNNVNASGISLSDAYRAAAAHPAGFALGGVAIPERHAPAVRSESLRLIEKAANGCDYFISQAVYDSDSTIALLHDYASDCAERGLSPRRILLTFTPCGRAETLHFLHWLGIRIPPAVEKAILGSSAPLTESVRLCADALQRILESGAAGSIPLGINVESVSIKREEIEASVDLFGALRDVIAKF